ncbi:hypothetical protein A2U01_0099462, partial [Trifolium medium]|nr:hypothetical protein [Trifolium medium]
CKKGEIE